MNHDGLPMNIARKGAEISLHDVVWPTLTCAYMSGMISLGKYILRVHQNPNPTNVMSFC